MSLSNDTLKICIYELEDKQLNSDGFDWLHADDLGTWAGNTLVQSSDAIMGTCYREFGGTGLNMLPVLCC